MSRQNTLDDEPNTVTLWTWVRIAFYFALALALTIYENARQRKAVRDE